jgi:hypothetical protein
VDGDRRMKGGDHYLTIAGDKFFGKQGKAA